MATQKALVAPLRHENLLFFLRLLPTMERRIREDATICAPNGGVSIVRAMERRGGRGATEGELKSAVEEQVIRWERFLPRRFLRVLLVEYDDSTRHIVAALLRKCSYQVAAVADGLKAWDVLKEKHYNFDLVLTEVEMPQLSGIDLLSKIMGNEICKSIPVIMMSSHDSMSTVFKCMLKGAADFLVKPVRKNELKNLWQHVWRKYCSSSSGNGPENENPNHKNIEAASGNNAASNHASTNAGNTSQTGENDEDGSDSQSSCSKPETEIGTVRKQGKALCIENKKLSSKNESKLEKYDSGMAKIATTSSINDNGEENDKSPGIEIKITLSIQAAVSTEKISGHNGIDDKFPCRENGPGLRCDEGFSIDPNSFCQNEAPTEPSTDIIDFIGTIAAGQAICAVLEDNTHRDDTFCKAAKSSDVKDGACNLGSSPLWELSLRRPQLSGQKETEFPEKRILNHSSASAFSRYGNAGTHISCPRTQSSPTSLCIKTGECARNCHPHSVNDLTGDGKSVSFSVQERLTSSPGNGGEALMYCQLVCNSNKEDADPLAAGSSRANACVGYSFTEDTVFSHSQLGVISLPISVGGIPFQNLCAGYGALLQPIFYSEPSLPVQGSATTEQVMVVIPSDHSGHSDNQVVSNLQSINYHHFDKNYNTHQLNLGMEDQRDDMEQTDHRDVLQSTTDMTGQSARSILNINGSSGSNDDTNAGVNAGGALESGNEDGFQQNSNGKALDCERTRREAALTKFRLKRKDRCFEKKIRYHSRKKLAEQRPRLKGQFVRRADVE
eukprot:TRINITY_DN2860_c0_g3_i1.p1 TRINITY_DN2860_c0_g3~~TRINITY_DN2860_c0_g3_i1.p1  ORF type:complete len:784 (-),score=154.20 TRINITY_DN2860_c0_g3_i1:189-2540(-)